MLHNPSKHHTGTKYDKESSDLGETQLMERVGLIISAFEGLGILIGVCILVNMG